MGSTNLIDAIVRQTTLLIAALATAQGQRAPLEGVAQQVFADLVRELRAQGLGNKVIADMFGLGLRTYHNRVARLAESRSAAGRSVWEAVLAFVQERGIVLRADVQAHFHRDDPAVVRGVLKDLVDSALLFRTGTGDRTAFRMARPDELPANDVDRQRVLENLVLVSVFQRGPIGAEGLGEVVPVQDEMLDGLLGALVEDGRVQTETRDGTEVYRCDRLVMPFQDAAGWEAGLFDHYQAMVTAICTKLRLGDTVARREDVIGGSTYSFDIWAGHPLEQEVLGTLARLREQTTALRQRVERHNEDNTRPKHAAATRVITYLGQTIREEEPDA